LKQYSNNNKNNNNNNNNNSNNNNNNNNSNNNLRSFAPRVYHLFLFFWGEETRFIQNGKNDYTHMFFLKKKRQKSYLHLHKKWPSYIVISILFISSLNNNIFKKNYFKIIIILNLSLIKQFKTKKFE